MPLRRYKGWSFGRPPEVPFELNRNSPQANGLVFWMPFFLPSRGIDVANEYIHGVGQNGLITGAPWVNSEGGWALSFTNGNAHVINDFVASGILNHIELSAPFTWMIWCKPTSAAGFRGALAKNVTANPNFYFDLETDEYHWRWTVLGTAESFKFVYAANGKIQQFVGTCDVAGAGKGYIDGVQRGTHAWHANIYAQTLDISEIGRMWGNSSYTFDGLIQEVRLYDRELDPAEVWQQHSPETRWDLYLPVRRIWPVTVAVAAGNPWYAYAQQ